MAEINIVAIDENTYQVTVVAGTTTTHIVTVQLAYAAQLCREKINTAALIKKSFEFLLSRESNSSILRRFDLSVISQYFPEFEREMTEKI